MSAIHSPLPTTWASTTSIASGSSCAAGTTSVQALPNYRSKDDADCGLAGGTPYEVTEVAALLDALSQRLKADPWSTGQTGQRVEGVERLGLSSSTLVEGYVSGRDSARSRGTGD